MKPIKKIALFHSLCGVGKASITNMLPILSVMGMEVCPIPTILLSTHTGGFTTPSTIATPASYIRACADHYKENNLDFDAIFIGYLGNDDMTDAIVYFLNQFPNALKILDPIMGDHGKFYRNITEKRIQFYQEICKYVDLLLPNITEACFLTNTDYKGTFSQEEIMYICEKLRKLGCDKTLITSVSLAESQKAIVSFDATGLNIHFVSYESENFHGTGDVFDAIVIGKYLENYTLSECITQAHEFVRKCIHESSQFDYPKREGLLIEKFLSLLV